MLSDSVRATAKHFEFGRNWRRFLKVLNEKRIISAEASLREMLSAETLADKRFLDAGCGSGLFSLAARRLGAQVLSFDVDPQSVACTGELRRRYSPNDPDWFVEHGSVTDDAYLSRIGRFDIVYAWGVLHHTGKMWESFEKIIPLVKEGGQIFIAIYNDQGMLSNFWRVVKRIYNNLPSVFQFMLELSVFIALWGVKTLRDFLHAKPFQSWRNYSNLRGMSPWHDVKDWVGGYPFEVARPDDVMNFYKQRGFIIEKLKTCGGKLGCNEFVFKRG